MLGHTIVPVTTEEPSGDSSSAGPTQGESGKAPSASHPESGATVGLGPTMGTVLAVRAVRSSVFDCLYAGVAALTVEWVLSSVELVPTFLGGAIDWHFVAVCALAGLFLVTLLEITNKSLAVLVAAVAILARIRHNVAAIEGEVRHFDVADQAFAEGLRSSLESMGLAEDVIRGHVATLGVMLVRENLWFAIGVRVAAAMSALAIAFLAVRWGRRAFTSRDVMAWRAGIGPMVRELLGAKRGTSVSAAARAVGGVEDIRTVRVVATAARAIGNHAVSCLALLAGLYVLMEFDSSWAWGLLCLAVVTRRLGSHFDFECPKCGWDDLIHRDSTFTSCRACNASFLVMWSGAPSEA